jgi:hypothetical protein
MKVPQDCGLRVGMITIALDQTGPHLHFNYEPAELGLETYHMSVMTHVNGRCLMVYWVNRLPTKQEYFRIRTYALLPMLTMIPMRMPVV